MKNINSNQTALPLMGEMEGAPYVSPSIEVVPQQYSEGLMDSVSMGIGTGGTTGTIFSKPGGEWGDTWTEQPKESGDDWGI